MKKRDIFQLAWLRIKNKNSIRSFTAMIFGLIMLVEVLWLAFAINFHLQSQINDTPISNLFLIESNAVESVDIRTQKNIQNYQGIQLTYGQKQSLQIEDEVVWTEFVYSVSENEYSNSDLEFSIDGELQNIENNFKIKFIKNAQVKTLPDSIETYLQDTCGHGGIYGDKFGDSKRELYISEIMLDRLGLSRDEAIGENVSLSMVCGGEGSSRSYLFDDDTIFDNQHIKCYDVDAKALSIDGRVKIFCDFRIVGVISREYYSVNNLTASDCDIWMKEDVLTNDEGESLFPRISVQDVYYGNFATKTDRIVLTYPSVDYIKYSEQVTAKGCFFPFFAGGLRYVDMNLGRWSSNDLMPTYVSYVQCDDFKDAKKLAKKVRDYIIENSWDGASYYNRSHCSREFNELWIISDTIDKVSVAFSIIGGLTLLTVIFNYGNVVSFNARKRIDFLSMMKKIGMTEKDKDTLVNMEIFGGFAIVLIIAFLVGLIIATILRLIITKLISEFSLLSNIKIALWLYLPAFLIVAVVMFIAMVLITVNGKNKIST